MEQDMALATIQAQLAHLTSQLTHNAERTTMPSVPTFDVPYGKDIKLINVLNLLQTEMLGVIKSMINQATTCFPTLTIRIGEIIQIICGINLNNFNKVDIGSKKRSSIQDLCSHHNLPHNNSNRIQVCPWIIIKFLMN